MYVLSSMSVSVAPDALAMNRGVPPTAPNARTGEFTPPASTKAARSAAASDLAVTDWSFCLVAAIGSRHHTRFVKARRALGALCPESPVAPYFVAGFILLAQYNSARKEALRLSAVITQ